MKTQNRAKSVSNVLFLKTVLSMGQYDKKKNKFMKELTHTELANTFRYSNPQISYQKYRDIKIRLMNATNARIVLPNIPQNTARRGRKSQINKLIEIVDQY